MKNKIKLFVICLSLSLFGSVAAADTAEDQFKAAMEARESGDLDAAIAGFHSILGNQPELHRARLELAVAYLKARKYAEAKKNAEQVLNDPQTPQNVRLAILSFLAKIKKEEEGTAVHQWRPSILVGVEYDSNVNVGPSSSAVTIGTSTLRVVPGSTARSDWARIVSVGLNHTYEPGKEVTIGSTKAGFIWQSQGNIYHKGYDTESDNFNLDILSFSTGPALISLGDWRTNLNGRVDYIYLGNNELALFTSLEPSFTWHFDKGEVTVDLTYTNRDYTQAVDAGRDSDYVEGAVSVGRHFLQGKVALSGGFTYFTEDAKMSIFSRSGYEVFAGINWRAWDRGAVFFRAVKRDAKHDGREPVFGIRRDEEEERFLIGFRHKLAAGFGLQGWEIRGTGEFTDHRSNVKIFDFGREQFQLTIGRSF